MVWTNERGQQHGGARRANDFVKENCFEPRDQDYGKSWLGMKKKSLKWKYILWMNGVQETRPDCLLVNMQGSEELRRKTVDNAPI